MSKQVKKGGGKRPREHKAPPPEEPSLQDVVPVKYSPQPTPVYGSASFSDVYQPSIHRSGGLGSLVQPGSMHSIQPSFTGKVAIPALRTSQVPESKALRKGRTQHACDTCRKAKAGCSGGNPCSRCKTMKSNCVYGDGKREKEKKELTKLSKETVNLAHQNTEVMQTLRRIRDDHQLSRDGMRAAIDEVISRNVSPSIGFDSPTSTMRQPSSEPDENADSGEQDADADVGSTGSLDVVALDTDRNETRGIGHLGKSSAVAWQHRTEEAIGLDPNFLGEGDQLKDTITMSSYHTEDADLEYFDTSTVNMYAWPSAQLAGELVESYFTYIHDIFPILNKKHFLSRFHTFPRNSGQLSKEDFIWLGILNIVFAISSTHGRLMATPNLGNPSDHRLYCARATLIFSNQEIYLQDSRVSSTCGLGLLSLYYLANNRLNRAWLLGGLAIRHALTLGLHVRSTALTLSDADKEHRVRSWWSLYSLECTLNELLGRPSCIADRDISTPMPINIEESDLRTEQALYDRMEGVQLDQSIPSSGQGSRGSKVNPAATYQMPLGFSQPIAAGFPPVPPPMTSSTFFIYRTQLSIVSHEIITELYCAATSKEKWFDVENTIRRIDDRLLKWAAALPPNLNVNFDTYSKPDFNNLHAVYRTGLAMLFNSSRMILFRPCLCRFEGRIHNQSERSKRFNQDSVQKCVHSARRTITLLHLYSSTPSRFYAIPPFWNTLHCLCQALSVLMLELAFKSEHVPEQTADILEDAKRGIRWLIMMSEQSIGARKAWEIFDRLIRMVAPMISWSVYDLPNQAPIPPGYNSLGIPIDPATGFQSNPLTQPSSAFRTPSSASQSYPLAPNPLDFAAATERFFYMGQLHGQYDDPWQHHFSFVAGEGETLANPEAGMMQHVSESDVAMGGEPERGGFRETYSKGYGSSQGFGDAGPSGTYGHGGGGGF